MQPNARTIESVLKKTTERITRESIKFISSSRTDAGVHSLGHVVNFHCRSSLSLKKLHHGINSLLPEDISIRNIEEVPHHFHARFDATAKQYRYILSASKHPLTRKYIYMVGKRPDGDAMRRPFEVLKGKNDFRAFCKHRDIPHNPVCNIVQISLMEKKDLFIFDIKADRFLHHMVRTIVGTLLQVGWGRIHPDEVKEILRGKIREKAGPTAPPCGLILLKVFYEGNEERNKP
jgi:tRNA pseudouridine38-40 synthase